MSGEDEDRQTIEAGAEEFVFDGLRSSLLSLAYRMLGSRTEAEDAVQDTFLRWQETDRASIRNPGGWLTTACTRRCIDILRSAEKQRVEYVGAWLPESVHTPVQPEEETAVTLAKSLTTAFLLMLERLSPKERAAYLLHDVFELPYSRIADILGVQETACRKLVSRARSRIGQSDMRAELPPIERQEELLAAFHEAITTGDTTTLAEILSEDIEIRHDSGGKVGAALHVLRGKAAVLEFIQTFLHRVWSKYRWTVTELNGARGILLEKDGVIVTAVSFAFAESGQAGHIFIQRNPDKLASLTTYPVASWRQKLA